MVKLHPARESGRRWVAVGRSLTPLTHSQSLTINQLTKNSLTSPQSVSQRVVRTVKLRLVGRSVGRCHRCPSVSQSLVTSLTREHFVHEHLLFPRSALRSFLLLRSFVPSFLPSFLPSILPSFASSLSFLASLSYLPGYFLLACCARAVRCCCWWWGGGSGAGAGGSVVVAVVKLSSKQ